MSRISRNGLSRNQFSATTSPKRHSHDASHCAVIFRAMNVVVCIASHHRSGPLNIVLRCLPEDWHAVVVVTDKADVDAIIPRERTHVFTHPNEPLGAKWQRTIDEARKLDPDYLIITGSDDVLLGDTTALTETMRGMDLLVFTAWTIFDGSKHWKAKYNALRSTHKPPIGGGRIWRHF